MNPLKFIYLYCELLIFYQSKMRNLQEKVEYIYNKIFSEAVKKNIEKATLWISIIGFIAHLLLIYGKKFELFTIPFETDLLNNPISAIYTPFTIILIYEIYLLVVNLPRSFTTSVLKQFEIISLILIRRIFADIPKIDLKAAWFSTPANVQLIYDVLGVLILYYLIYLFNKSRQLSPKKCAHPNVESFVTSKKAISLVLFLLLIIISFTTAINWCFDVYSGVITENINVVFYNEFFSILILTDVFILLLSFQYTESYTKIIRNTGFIICTILIRLSFGVAGLTNVVLIISSVLFGLIILSIYNLSEKPLKEVQE